MKFCLCVVNVAIDLSHLPQIPAAATDPSCASTSSANILIGIGCPHALPSCANLHSPALAAPPPTISRGFFPWRLSDAGLGASRTAAVRRHPKPSTAADIPADRDLVSNVPTPEVAGLFNHLVGDSKHSRRNCQAECLGGLEIDDEIELCRLLHREFGWARAL